jgi:putative urate catabolism protein
MSGFENYPRDLIGYGQTQPKFEWPNNAKIAVQFVLNVEEGGENCILHGDTASEAFLSEIIGAQPFENARHMSMESIYEYGSRRGSWRILKLFRDYNLPITLFVVATAAQRNPAIIEQALKDGHEIASHGLKWINYHGMPEHLEKEHMEQAVEILTNISGQRPVGWYTGRTSENTRKLVAQDGSFLYDSDDYSDDLPFWSKLEKNHLIVPYTLDANDMRFATPQGFNSANQFYNYLKDTFDTLYDEGTANPKMMSIGMHARLLGRPGRFKAIKDFVKYIASFEDIWVARRDSIAHHWTQISK